MFLLLCFIFLIQFFVFWIYEPFTIFLTNLLAIRLLPGIVLLTFLFLFSAKNDN